LLKSEDTRLSVIQIKLKYLQFPAGVESTAAVEALTDTTAVSMLFSFLAKIL